MMGFEWWFAALALLAGLFVAWPLLISKGKQLADGEGGGEVRDRMAFNDALFAEQVQELEQQLDRAEVSQSQYEKLKKELESQHAQDNDIQAYSGTRRRLRHAPWVVVGLAVVLPLSAYFLYDSRGAGDDWDIQQLNTQLSRQQERGADPEARRALNEELFSKLEARLEEQPDNLNNRFLLARTAVELGELRRALSAYQHILERQPNSPQVVGEMAQVLFMASGNQFTPQVQQMFDRALEMDPDNSELLGFAGIGAYQSGKFQLAIDYWQKGMDILEPSDPRHRTWQRAIAEARQQLGDDAVQQEGRAQADDPAAAPKSLQVSVQLGEGVEVDPDDRVFVYARAWEGAKMPLAMQESRVADLPLTLELDESMNMIEGMTMSRFPELEVVARISSSGVADAQSGDWQATAGPVDSDNREETVKLVIDSQIP